MASLRERAAGLAGREPLPVEDEAAALLVSAQLPAEVLPELTVDDSLDPESAKLSAIQAWSRVRRDIRAIGKNEQYNANGTRYNFRGVETAINAFSPVTLHHGVNVIPVKKVSEYFETATSGGKRQVDCRVTVTWHIYGPMDDFFVAETCGQALDTQDKASAKAQSVALRVLLYEAGMIPTHEVDPEYTAHDRGEARTRDPQDYFTEILKKSTSRDRFVAIRGELMRMRLAREPIVNEEGEHEELVTALDRIGKERFAPQSTPADSNGTGTKHIDHEPGRWVSGCPACQADRSVAFDAAERDAAARSFCERCEQHGHNSDKCPTLDGAQ